MRKLPVPILLLAAGVALVGLSVLWPGGGGRLEVEVVRAGLVMPAAHKVYENPDALDGKYYLFKARLTNSGTSDLEDVTARYRMPGYVEWTDLETVGRVIPGQSVVVVAYPRFEPAITAKTTESMERVDLEVTWSGADERDEVEESFPIKVLSRNDFAYTNLPNEEIATWQDMFDNNDLFPVFVTPNDPVVKYYTQIVQEKVLRGETAAVTNSTEQGVRFLMGIYEATRMSHMVYSGTKGVPRSLDDVETIVQHIRLPREVITGNTGLCIELSALYASVMSAAGMDPVLFFVPNHAYPGFRMNGQYFAIEATSIGGEGIGGIATAEAAFKRGSEELQEFIQAAQAGDPRYSIVDVHTLNAKGAVSMNLDDDDFLRRKVDEIAENFSGGRGGRPGAQALAGAEAGQGGATTPGAGSGAGRFPGPLSFVIPPGWTTFARPMPQLPILTAQVSSPDGLATVSVFDVPAPDAATAMSVVSARFAGLGFVLEYQISGSSVAGNTYQLGSVFQWRGRLARTSSGYRFVAVGAGSQVLGYYATLVENVYNSIQ